MPVDPTAFDSRLNHTSQWMSPHHQLLDTFRRNLGWEDSPAGKLILRGMEERGLTETDVCVMGTEKMVGIAAPEGVSRHHPSAFLTPDASAGGGEVEEVLDVTLANLARDRMLRADGWMEDDDDLPAWSMLSTPLLTMVLELGGYRAVDLWALPDEVWGEDDRIVSDGVPVGDARDALPAGWEVHRDACRMLVDTGCASGIHFNQDLDGTVISIDHPLIRADAPPAAGACLADHFLLPKSSLGGLFGTFVIDQVLDEDGDDYLLKLVMPATTLEPIPSGPLASIGLNWVELPDRSYPWWTSVRRIARWTPPLSPPPSTPDDDLLLVAPWPPTSEMRDLLEKAAPESPTHGLESAVAVAVAKQAPRWRQFVAQTIAGYLRFRVDENDDLANVINEHRTAANLWISRYLNHVVPERIALLRNPARYSPDLDARRKEVATMQAPTVRALRTFYAELKRLELRSPSQMDDPRWDEPVGS